MNNIVYIAATDLGLMKIGYTKKSSSHRIKQFAKHYPTPFKEVTSFEVEEVNAESVEKFIHEILNAQFLNLKLMYDKFNFVEYESYMKNSPDGYTEIFLSNPNIINNLFTFLHSLGFIKLTDNDIEKINQIPSFKENELKKYYPEINQFIEEEGKKEGFASPNIITKRTNIFKNNFDKWMKDIPKDSNNIELLIENNDFFLVSKNRKIRLENFLFGNTEEKNCIYLKKNLIINYDIDFLIDSFFYSLVKLEKQNTNMSTQRSSFQYKNEKFLAIQHTKKLKLTQLSIIQTKTKDFQSFLKDKENKDIILSTINEFTNYLEKYKDIISSEKILDSDYFKKFINCIQNNELDQILKIKCNFYPDSTNVEWTNISLKYNNHTTEESNCYFIINYILSNLEKKFNNNFNDNERTNIKEYFIEKNNFVFSCLSATIEPEILTQKVNYKYFNNSALDRKYLESLNRYCIGTNKDIRESHAIQHLLDNNHLLSSDQTFIFRERSSILSQLFVPKFNRPFYFDENIKEKLNFIENKYYNLGLKIIEQIKTKKCANRWKEPIKTIEEYFLNLEKFLFQKEHNFYIQKNAMQDFLNINIDGKSIECHLLSINANKYINNKFKNSNIKLNSFSNLKQFQLSRSILNYSDNKIKFSNEEIINSFCIFLSQSNNKDLNFDKKTYELQTITSGLNKLKEKNISIYAFNEDGKSIFDLLSEFEKGNNLCKEYTTVKTELTINLKQRNKI